MEVGGQAGTAGGPAVRLGGESRRWHRRVGTWRRRPAGGAGAHMAQSKVKDGRQGCR